MQVSITAARYFFKTAFLCIALVAACSAKAHAEDGESVFFVEPYFSLTYGSLGEHLYTKSTAVENPLTSYLEWQELPIARLGLTGGLFLGRIDIQAGAEAAFPYYCGSMLDSDWFKNTNVRQSFSISREKVLESYGFNLQAGYRFTPSQKLSLTPFVGVSLSYIFFYCDAGGKGFQDPSREDDTAVSWDSPLAQEFVTAEISYWRTSIFTWAGLSSSIKFNSLFTLNLLAAVSPFTGTISEDFHSNNSEYYHDIANGFFCASRFNAEAQFFVSPKISIDAGITLISLSTIYGPTYTSKMQGYLGSMNKGQYIGASQLDVSFYAGARFFF